MMAGRQTTDIATAFLIGALFGVGATLLLRGNREREIDDVMHRLHHMKKVVARRVRPPGRTRALVESLRERLS